MKWLIFFHTIFKLPEMIVMWLYTGLIRVTYWFVRLNKNFTKIFTRTTFAVLICEYKRLFALTYRTTPSLQSLCAQQLQTGDSGNTSMAEPGLDLMCKCKPHTTAQSQELLRTIIKPSLSTRVSTFIDPNGKSKKICKSQLSQPEHRKMRSRQKCNRSRQDNSSRNQG